MNDRRRKASQAGRMAIWDCERVQTYFEGPLPHLSQLDANQAHERPCGHRMDRRHVEPGPRLYEGEPSLQVLLRRGVR
jgi:hypothetical protein